ncbi:unannotated protein [freshwater metagenome]|uniref:Unannotated protein n=1 Tax=freshwater metagenome TaxID=449393 RepID=A0A6J7DS88_9ZZZZ|nr:decaprenyl-phosphate phosphoribosyltransferase [Actinomycetota bacterium]
MIGALLKEARPKQWTKNVLVFAAPGAAGVLSHGDQLLRSLVTFAAFCLAASGTYYWNDILDVEADRAHVRKRNRPIASGAVPIGLARIIGTLLLLAGPALAFAVRWQAGAACVAYIVLTSTYSMLWKHIAVVDLAAVASGFVLRAVAGAAGTNVHMSTWFVLCTTFGSLFIVTGKRYAELRELGDNPTTARATLDYYSMDYLRTVLAISCGSALVSYCLWAFEAKEISGTRWPSYELSIVPMLIALLRYLLIIEQGHGAAPEEIFAADRTLQVLGVVWLVIFASGVYIT